MKHKQKGKSKNEELSPWGSGNVFVDLGFTKAEANELTMKSFLTWAVQDAIKESNSTQAAIAKRLGIDQPKVSKLRNGNMSDFSVGRLIEFLLDFGYDIRIGITAASKKDSRGRLMVDIDERRKTPLRRRRVTA